MMKKYNNILLSTEKYKIRRDYWIQNLCDLEVEQMIRTRLNGKFHGCFAAKKSTIEYSLTPEISGKLVRLSKNSDVALHVVLMSAFIWFLHKYTGKTDIFFASPVYKESENDVLFNDIVVFRKIITGELTFKDLLMEVKQSFIKTCENQDYPFDKIINELNFLTGQTYDLLFDLIFICENIHNLEDINYKNSHLLVSFLRTGENIRIAILYNRQFYEKSEIERIAKYFNRTIECGLDNLTVKLPEVDILSEKEKKWLLFEINHSNPEYSFGKTLHQEFEEQVRKTPNNISVVFAEKQLTYRTLNKMANRLAQQMRVIGVKPGIIAGIMIERSIEMITGILAILKSGGVYLPIDPLNPEERTKHMLEDSNAKVFLTSPILMESLIKEEELFEGESLVIDNESLNRGEVSNLDNASRPGDPAYVMYTSGSTGKPKGVIIEHKSAINLVLAQRSKFKIDEDERILQFSPYYFDASVEQIFLAFFSGAALILVDEEILMDMDQFEKLTSYQCITHIHAVPSFLNHIKLENPHHLKRIISGGDICPGKLARKWYDACDFYNEYGPTETTVTSTEFMVNQLDETPSGIPIGKPLSNTAIYIFDKWMRLVPPGAIGELYIGGVGVARGYLNEPDLTREKFVENPFGYRERLYKTGDLGRILPDGNFEFIGRMDHQVKIRGYRIESNEIESRLLGHDQIKQVVVVPLEEEKEVNQTYLWAYMVLHQSSATEKKELTVSELRKYLQHTLPDYMIPSYFVTLETIPLTPNGKINRKALPQPSTRIKTDTEYIEPKTNTEKTISRLWKEVLQLDKVGINDNFFELGGNSIIIIKLHDRLKKSLNENITITTMFRYPTIASLSNFMDQDKTRGEEHSNISDRSEKIKRGVDKKKQRRQMRKRRIE